jgi:membrane protease YdiL (CAAX protease family)/pimeloyl-ACP methyl ester carboxylesterase
MSGPIPLILFSGLGADDAIFCPQRLAFPQMIVPPWPIPTANDTLDSYAARLAGDLDVRGPCILGGASFGGIVAMHVAGHLNPLAVLLIGSAREPAELPAVVRLARRVRPLIRWLPVSLLQFLAVPGASTVAARWSPHLAGLARQFRRSDPRVVVWSIEQLCDWRTVPTPACPVFRIHGDRDRVISPRHTQPDERIAGGGHVISLTHPKEVNRFIDAALKRTVTSESTENLACTESFDGQTMTEPCDLPNPNPSAARAPTAEGARTPGPGILAAVAWAIGLLVFQNAFVILAVVLGLGEAIPFPVLLLLPAFLGVLLIVGLNLRHDIRRSLALRGLPWSHVACLLLCVAPMAVVVAGASHWLRLGYLALGVSESWLAPPPQYREALQQASLPVPATLAILVFFLGILPGTSEELFFRGFLGRGLIARWGVVGGVILTSMLFGAMHASLIQSAYATGIGILLHAAYLWSRSLSAPMILHVAFNIRGAFLALIPEDSSPPWLIEAGPPPFPLLLAGAASLAALCWLYSTLRVRWILPNGDEWTPGYDTAEMPPVELGARPECHRASAASLIVAAGTCLTFLLLFGWEASR